MGRKRLKRYQEVRAYPNYTEVAVRNKAPFLIDKVWNPDSFEKNQEITLEVGCGRGEYTLALAARYPGRNFLGVDIKGDRICLGARSAMEKKLKNVFFTNIQVDHLPFYLPENSISQIWIPFPDPQPGNEDGRMRLTSERFLNIYKHLLRPGSDLHFKTDDSDLYDFSLESLCKYNAVIKRTEPDLHHSAISDFELMNIKTTYENRYISDGKRIKYIHFSLT